jgi:KDO2-lipid IV(A) lauroyltransferase
MISRFMIVVLGWTWWLILPVRKRMARANLLAAFPDADAGQLRRTVGGVAWGYIELLFGRGAQVDGAEQVPPGSICIGGHSGSWDLILLAVARVVPTTIFVKTPSNPVAAWVIGKLRARVDLELLPPHDSMQAAYAALEAGRMVIFVQDQRHNRGIEVPFLGRPARTSAAFASMLHRTRAPVVGLWQERNASGHRAWLERLEIHIPENREEAIESLTRESQDYYGGRIADNPPNWWWLHNRWKRIEDQ